MIPPPGPRRRSLPFTGISRVSFVPALRPPETPPRAAAWFAFRGDRLLVRATGDDRADLLDYDALADLGANFEAGHYLGPLDDLDCYVAELDPAVAPPAGASREGLRA